jgi:hypothetical protein
MTKTLLTIGLACGLALSAFAQNITVFGSLHLGTIDPGAILGANQGLEAGLGLQCTAPLKRSGLTLPAGLGTD